MMRLRLTSGWSRSCSYTAFALFTRQELRVDLAPKVASA
jgi:hypothetical protein